MNDRMYTFIFLDNLNVNVFILNTFKREHERVNFVSDERERKRIHLLSERSEHWVSHKIPKRYSLKFADLRRKGSIAVIAEIILQECDLGSEPSEIYNIFFSLETVFLVEIIL